jgi:pimeloyl-ACP methyl ester carboxylesterase
LVILGSEDKVISPVLGRKLYDNYGGHKKLIVLPGRGHNTISSQNPVEYWSPVISFINGY